MAIRSVSKASYCVIIAAKAELNNHMKNCVGVTFLTAMLVSAPILAGDPECAEVGDPLEIENVRAQRQAFNVAIVNKDDRAIRNILHKNVILVTGTDSDLFEDRDAQVAIWQDDFSRDDRAIYVRTPACFRVSGVVPVAFEVGAWRGESVVDSRDFAAGSYSAKWRKLDDQWLLEAEIFSTEACGGSFCPSNAGLAE